MFFFPFKVGIALAEQASSLVITKLWRSHYSNDSAQIAARLGDHLKALQRVIDCWLIHWPGPGKHPKFGTNKPADWSPAMRIETFKAMLKLLDAGKMRSVGVSNFSCKQIQGLYDATGTEFVLKKELTFLLNVLGCLAMCQSD